MPELSFHDVEALMRQTASKDVKPSSSKSWLTSNDIQRVLEALDNDAACDKVYIVSQGRMFNIKHRDDKVWISPFEGFAPCGWFSPTQLKKELSELHVVPAS